MCWLCVKSARTHRLIGDKVKKIIVPLVLALMVTLGFMALPASSASASTSCYGSSCDGLNPATTSCANDAYTIFRHDAVTASGDWGNLELRYSPSCYSNWVRFTPWYGIRAWLGAFTGGEVGGLPWIWRAGVANSLRGEAGQSGAFGFGQSSWTAMVTAAGTTCSSVGVYDTQPSSSGQGDRDSLGTYNAPCIS